MRVSGTGPSLLALVLVLSAPLGACTAITGFNQFHGGGGGPDSGLDAHAGDSDAGPTSDTGPRPDTGMSSMCTPACLADEDCCGGECVDLLSDPDHCGDCTTVCPDRDNSTPACDELGCDFDCDAGFDDCDAEDSNGCEQRLNTAAACGSCDNACSGATPICNGATGTCVGSCSGTEMECDGTCVDVMGSDVTHCGSCTNVCAMLPGATRTCVRGGCEYGCEGGMRDCDGDLGMAGSNGCESREATYYGDADGDGFGAGAPMLGCMPTTGASSVDTDCNDRDALVFPGASEACNGVDDDCDRTVDDGFAVNGVEVGGACACTPGAANGAVACESSSRAICRYPAEVCNALDDDCDGASDDGFACVRGASSTCTGSGTISGCTYTGTSTCDASCMAGPCMPPAETCDARDEDCDGFPDDGRLGVGTDPVGYFAPGGALPTDRAVAAAWRDSSNGGAVLVFRDSGIPGVGAQALNFFFVDRAGANGAGFSWTVSSSTATARPTGQAALAWDGAQWVVWFGFNNGGMISVRRVTITPEPGGAISSPVTESTSSGVTALAAARDPGGDIGVVFTTPTQALTGVWRAGAWARVPTASIVARSALDGAAIAAVGAGRFLAVTSDTGGAAAGIITQPFTGMGTESVFQVWPGMGFTQPQAVFEPLRNVAVIAWLEGLEMRVVRWDPAGSLVGGAAMPGSARAPRLGAGGGGDIFVARGPDMQRMQRDTGMLSGESIAPGFNLDAIVGTPGATQSALVFHGTAGGVVSRAVRCM